MSFYQASSDSITEPFAHLHRSIASEIQNLPAEERFQRLQKLKFKYNAGLSSSLEQLLGEGDDTVSKNNTAQALEQTLQDISSSLVEFGTQYQNFLHALERLVHAAFEGHVSNHIRDHLCDLDYSSKVAQMASYHNFPLYKRLENQSELRSTLHQSLSTVNPDQETAKEAGRQFKTVTHLKNCFEDVFMVQELTVHFAACRTDIIRHRILDCITYHPPHDLKTRISRLEDPRNISLYRYLMDRIPLRELMIWFLEGYGNTTSVALKEERDHLGDLSVVRDKFIEVIESMLEEYRSLLG